MKKLIYLSSAFLLGLTLVVGCQKSQFDKPLQLIAAKTTIKLLETDSLVLVGAERDSVKWTVTPSGLMFHNSNKATVLFYQPGTYVVTATDPGHEPLSKTITVLNESYYPANNPPPPPPVTHDTTKIIPVAGDLIITPKVYREPNTDSLDLVLNIKSSVTYACGNSWFNLTQSQTNNNFVINIPNVTQPPNSSCARPNTQIDRTIAFYPNVKWPVVVGTSYPLTITVGNKTYTGSVVYTKDYVDITWPYASGVTFTAIHAAL